jgi:hypothetical protein
MSSAGRDGRRRALVVVALAVVGGARASVARADDATAKPPPAVVAASPSGSDQVVANARELYRHLQITFIGKDAFRENLLLRGATFYDAVERPDLAERYRTLESRKTLVGTLGGVALGAGAAWGGIDLTIAKTDPRAHHSATVIPWAIAIAGLVTMIVAVALPGEVATDAERQTLAREHNERTAVRLGAIPDGSADPATGH